MARRGQIYNKIFTEERWERVCVDNKLLIDDFITELKSQKKKETTLKQYYNDLRIIAIYILEKLDNASILELNKKHFRNMTLWMIEKKMSNARCNRLMSAVRSMLTFAEEDDDYDYDNNVAKKVKGLQKEPVREIVFLTDEQIEKLRDKLFELGRYKHMVLLDISYDSVARRNEVAQVMKDGLLDRNYTNRVVGKRGKQFELVYFDKTKESLKLYLDQRGEDDIPDLWIIGEDNEDKTNRRPATYENLYDWTISMSTLLSEIEGEVILFNPHSWRHSGLENYHNGSHRVCKALGKTDGFTLDEIKVLANHSDLSTTASYLKNDDRDVLAGMFGIEMK